MEVSPCLVCVSGGADVEWALVFAVQSSTLVITLQPPSEFYKDEGGKSNFMTMIVTTPPTYIITGTIKLKAFLCYENEKRVEVGDGTGGFLRTCRLGAGLTVVVAPRC